jgi:hypothetical protein
LACLIRHPGDFYAFGEIIKPQFFNGPAAAELAFRILEYKNKFGNIPGFTVLGNFAFHKAARVNVDHAKETLEYVEKLAKIDTKDKDGVIDMCLNFAKERALLDAQRKVHAAQSEGKPIDVIKTFEEAMTVGNKMTELGSSIYHDVEKILRLVSATDYGVKTGYAEFDKLWPNGWGPGWLVILLAPPKRYKTATALNFALNIATIQDADVLYFTCEISEELAALRLYTNLTGWSQEELKENLERGIMVTKKAVKKLWGNIWMKGYPAMSVSIGEIKSHAKHVIRTCGLKPKSVF